MTMSAEPSTPTIVAPQVLLTNHLKALKLPTFAREYEKVAMESAQDRADYPRFLLRLCELERIDRERRNVERRIRLARFPQTKSFDTFDFAAQPSLNKALVLELIRCEWIDKRENCIALGPSGTGKTHVALGLGLAACQKGYSVAFATAAALVHELMEASSRPQAATLSPLFETYLDVADRFANALTGIEGVLDAKSAGIGRSGNTRQRPPLRPLSRLIYEPVIENLDKPRGREQ